MVALILGVWLLALIVWLIQKNFSYGKNKAGEIGEVFKEISELRKISTKVDKKKND